MTARPQVSEPAAADAGKRVYRETTHIILDHLERVLVRSRAP